MQNLRCIAPPTQQLDITLALSKAYWSVAPAKGLLCCNPNIFQSFFQQFFITSP